MDFASRREMLFMPLAKKVLTLALLVMFVFSGGCSSPPEVATGEVTLMVTRDFGKEYIFNEHIKLDSRKSVMDLLNQHLDVQTAYGGGFVNSINGLESGYTNTADKEKLDWFYFMNGIMTNVGATEYFPAKGDVIWWDYHAWGNIPFTPAVIGSFPQPFLNGYQGKNPGTLILFGQGCQDLAETLADYLKSVGVKEVEIKLYEEKLALDRSKITVVVALWEELADTSFWNGIQAHRDKTGWFAELEKTAFHGLNELTQRQVTYKQGAGAILATGMGMGDSTPLWLVTGLDKQGIADAVYVLTSEEGKISGHFGALVYNKNVVPLPIQQ